MADTNIGLYEFSQQDGEPVECYRFTHDISTYTYTSHQDDVMLRFDDQGMTRTETYYSTYIERRDISPVCKGDSSALAVSVSKDNPIAKLFQGFPPEKPVTLTIFRFHEQDKSKKDVVYAGRVGQASLEDSACILTVTLESWANREIPHGMRQFTCNNVVYDQNCQLVEEDWQVPVFVDSVLNNLTVVSQQFTDYADGYFANGIFRFNGSSRLIVEHKGDRVRLKYPFPQVPYGDVTVSPGCDFLFATCAKRFSNTLNFTGCLYVPPTDPQKKEVGRGVYWVDSQVIQRDTHGFVGTISM
ncbi:phage BR0599 family protein [Sporomusa sphaeroides DSM 2875]|uniref:phage BR0599 family protein n=1 Tax=Sporomusa sphaeroides TaxID=47679 RepID=UPI00202DD907|nr:phage BR0599 family protein [Sporomusa sphaeroides]MCM0759934.1 phage BR0599 family protein [Sporomusa sphaeroides DSM 2875]